MECETLLISWAPLPPTCAAALSSYHYLNCLFLFNVFLHWFFSGLSHFVTLEMTRYNLKGCWAPPSKELPSPSIDACSWTLCFASWLFHLLPKLLQHWWCDIDEEIRLALEGLLSPSIQRSQPILPQPLAMAFWGPAQSYPIVRQPELRSGSGRVLSNEDRQTLHFITHFSLKQATLARAIVS